jgi:hypothetical protein
MFCPQCGTRAADGALFCGACGASFTTGAAGPGAAPAKPMGEDAAMRMLLPVGRSGWAIAAGYLGLFSLCGFAAPFAILTGVLAIRDIKRNPEKHGMGRAVFGIIAGVVGLVILVAMIAGNVFKR